MSANWTVEEICELLAVRAEADIVTQIQETGNDSVVLEQITKRLRERGVFRTEAQINNKLKALQKQYRQIVDHNDQSNNTKTWAYSALCEAIWGSSQSMKPLTLVEEASTSSRPAQVSVPSFSTTPSTSNCLKISYTEEYIDENGVSWDDSVLSSGKNKVGLHYFLVSSYSFTGVVLPVSSIYCLPRCRWRRWCPENVVVQFDSKH